jgi:hypothetical protein
MLRSSKLLITIAGAAALACAAVPAAMGASGHPAAHAVSPAPDTSCLPLVNADGGGYAVDDAGEHNAEETTINSTCIAEVAAGPASQYYLKINGGVDCLKVVYPSTKVVADEPCQTGNSQEIWLREQSVYGGQLYANIDTSYYLNTDGIGNGEVIYANTLGEGATDSWTQT